MKEELNIFNDFIDEKIKSKRGEVRTQNKQRGFKRENIFRRREQKNKIQNTLCQVFLEENKVEERDKELYLSGHQFLDT